MASGRSVRSYLKDGRTGRFGTLKPTTTVGEAYDLRRTGPAHFCSPYELYYHFYCRKWKCGSPYKHIYRFQLAFGCHVGCHRRIFVVGLLFLSTAVTGNSSASRCMLLSLIKTNRTLRCNGSHFLVNTQLNKWCLKLRAKNIFLKIK